MTTIRLACNELRRVTTGRLPLLATIALVLVPLLYGSMYLYANHDPYAELDRVPAALVVQDAGGQTPDRRRLNAGDDVAADLVDAGEFAWRRTDAADAAAGVRDGRYTFSLTLPRDFSSSLTSSARFAPRQGLIQLTTNDANNYLGRTIADRVVDGVRAAVTKRVGKEAADRLLLGFASTHDRLTDAARSAQRLASGANQARDGSRRVAGGVAKLNHGQQDLATGTKRLADGSKELSTGLDTLRDKTSDLNGQTSRLASGARRVADGNNEAADAGRQVADASAGLNDRLDDTRARIKQELTRRLPPDEVNRVLGILDDARAPADRANSDIQDASDRLSSLASGAQRVSGGAAALAASAPGLTDGINKAADGADQLDAGAPKARDGARQAADATSELVGATTRLQSGNARLADGTAQLQGGLARGAGQVPDPGQRARKATAGTIADPVAVRSVGQARADSYGAGLAPFFFALAVWIGAFALFLLLRPLSARALAARTGAWRVALGGWLPAAALGTVQALALYLTVVLAVGVTPAHPVWTFVFLLGVAFSFTALVHGLNALFGAIGKFVALVLLVLQLVSAGGTFPWQTLPPALYPLHLVLPMGYAVDGLRHLYYGGMPSGLGTDIAVLAVWGVVGLALGVVAARRHRMWTAARLRPELAI